MFEKFRREKLTLPHFEADEERDALVEKYLRLQRESVAFSLDRDGFSDEEASEAKARIQELEDNLHDYVLPYAELTQAPENSLERQRWEAAQMVHKKGRYEGHGQGNWGKR